VLNSFVLNSNAVEGFGMLYLFSLRMKIGREDCRAKYSVGVRLIVYNDGGKDQGGSAEGINDLTVPIRTS